MVFEQHYKICAGYKEKDYFNSLGTNEKNIKDHGFLLNDPYEFENSCSKCSL